ncbi:restriction endonuclease [Vibrio sp. RE86]|uniref:restriction endonuclease n=1 Tax=Vibrio sp. RE86 TaxID=2607605 RepID=UPI001493B24F|nr:restriction endonuclease [Vibrio sp. RE86]NOH82057.1 restriction endonuclease [Vibrio sp. RE86]
MIPIDNKLIAIGEMHIAFLDCGCDTREYHQGRREVIARRKREQEILFDGGVYKWSERIDGERFEEFTRELLICKSGVVKVSNTSVTNEPDSNADLICIWDTVDLSDMPQLEAKSPIKRRKIVVQCKAWSKNIGKNDIPSIRDTLDRFDADGMLVVSSKSITRSLFDHIEALRRKGVWADFWDRAEVEGILDDNPGLVLKYPDIVSFDEFA